MLHNTLPVVLIKNTWLLIYSNYVEWIIQWRTADGDGLIQWTYGFRVVKRLSTYSSCHRQLHSFRRLIQFHSIFLITAIYRNIRRTISFHFYYLHLNIFHSISLTFLFIILFYILLFISLSNLIIHCLNAIFRGKHMPCNIRKENEKIYNCQKETLQFPSFVFLK